MGTGNVQTFLPSADFDETAQVLDNKRLHKQALEAWQILMVLTELDPQNNRRVPKGWVNHPAVKMWRDHEGVLYQYILSMVKEWQRRGYKSTIADKATNTITHYINRVFDAHTDLPTWMIELSDLERVTATHRQALLAKNYEWYSQFGWPEDSGTPTTEYEYYWPI
jgi:hypothetical protein